MEIERKFLIYRPADALLATKAEDVSTIVQTYLKSRDGVERRLRQRGTAGNWTLYVTEKTPTASPYEREEDEREITPDEYLDLMAEADPEIGQLVKTRWVIPHAGHVFEIDVYPFSKDLAIMEVELESFDEAVDLPAFIDILVEVTDDPDYRNASLATRRRL